MNIALDYDNTFSADRELWREFIKLAHARGHTVFCVSGRDDEPLHRQAIAKDVPSGMVIHLCCHRVKRTVLAERGVNIDIWIDDYPEGIVEAAAGKS